VVLEEIGGNPSITAGQEPPEEFFGMMAYIRGKRLNRVA